MFTIERYFKDNEHYYDYFGLVGDALVDSLSVFWTDKVYFEIEAPDPLKLRNPEDAPLIIEIDCNLRRMKVTRSDFMNCLKTFINAAGSEHPRDTINDYILKMNSQIRNAKNRVFYCSIKGKDAVSFEMMSHDFVETILFGAYFYWDCEYEIGRSDANRDTYKQYANYYLDELAEFTGLVREYVREHHLFKVYDEMKRIFITSFLKALSNSATQTGSPAQAYVHKSTRGSIPPVFQPLHFFNEILFSTDDRKHELMETLQPVIKQVKEKRDWYAVLRGAQSVNEGIDKFGRKHKVLADKASDVAMFDDLCMLMPELAENANIFPIDDNKAEATSSEKYNTLRKAVSAERTRWTIAEKGELLVQDWEKTEYIPSRNVSIPGKRINNKEDKYGRMLKIGKNVMEALEQLRDKYIQS